jgi:hypothetical protein
VARAGRYGLEASISERAILKIEKGQEVDTHLLMPVLVFLGLEDEPSLKRPLPGQHPGEWIRDLRDRGKAGGFWFPPRAIRPSRGLAAALRVSSNAASRSSACTGRPGFEARVSGRGPVQVAYRAASHVRQPSPA